MKAKTEIKEKTNRLIGMTAEYSDKFLDEEYKQLSEKLILKMSRKRNIPFMSGKEEIWAAGTVYALGQINFLFDRNSEPYVSADNICDYFNTKKSTTSQKAKKIRDLFNMAYWDEEFSTKYMKQNNPFDGLARMFLSNIGGEDTDFIDEFCDDSILQSTLFGDFEDEEYDDLVFLDNILNFKCKKCKTVFDYDVGEVTFPSSQKTPSFERDIHCSKCGIRSIDQIELTELGQTLLSEIFFSTEMDDMDEKEYSDEELENICDKVNNWGIEFSKSKYYEELTEEQKRHSEGIVMFFTEYMYNYNLLLPEEWDEDSTEECCLYLLPRKVSAEIAFFKAVSPVLSAFFNFLEEKKYLKNASRLAKRVKPLDKEIVKNASNPNNWGIAKSIVMMALKAGVDPSNEKEMQEFIQEYNKRMSNEAKNQPSKTRKFGRKVGRNEPCPCDSGKKYKKCCGRI